VYINLNTTSTGFTCSDSSHVTAPYKLSFYYCYFIVIIKDCGLQDENISKSMTMFDTVLWRRASHSSFDDVINCCSDVSETCRRRKLARNKHTFRFMAPLLVVQRCQWITTERDRFWLPDAVSAVAVLCRPTWNNHTELNITLHNIAVVSAVHSTDKQNDRALRYQLIG